MSKYNMGNDVAADEYADKVSRDQAFGDEVERIACEKLESAEWRAVNIDALMACSDCTDGVTDFAIELAAASLDHRYAQDYFSRLVNLLKARAYDQAEDEVNG